MSASIVLRLSRTVPLAEWDAFALEHGLVRDAGLFPYNVWRATTADIELRMGWPTAEQAKRRMPPADFVEIQITSYLDADLPETGRFAALVHATFGGDFDVVPEALRPYLERP